MPEVCLHSRDLFMHFNATVVIDEDQSFLTDRETGNKRIRAEVSLAHPPK